MVLQDVGVQSNWRIGWAVNAENIARAVALDVEQVRAVAEDLVQRKCLEPVRSHVAAELGRVTRKQLSPAKWQQISGVSLTEVGRHAINSCTVLGDEWLAQPARAGERPMEQDARRVLTVLAEYAVTDDDWRKGQHRLQGVSLQGMTNLPTTRLIRAVELLENRGHVGVEQFAGGDPRCIWVWLTANGQLEYEGPAPQEAAAAPALHLTVHGDLNTFRDVNAPSMIGGHGNTQHVTHGAMDTQAIRGALQEILDRLDELDLAPDRAEDVEANSQAALDRLTRSEPNMGAVQESAGLVVRLLEGAGGNAVYDGAKAVAPLAGELAFRLAHALGQAGLG